jgi:hypothetical protein
LPYNQSGKTGTVCKNVKTERQKRKKISPVTNFTTGYETLKEVLEENDMEAFKKKWEHFVLGLKKEF